MTSTKTSPRIATPSSRNSGRFTAPMICPAALGWRATPLGGSGGETADAEARANHDQSEPQRRAGDVQAFHPCNPPFRLCL